VDVGNVLVSSENDKITYNTFMRLLKHIIEKILIIYF